MSLPEDLENALSNMVYDKPEINLENHGFTAEDVIRLANLLVENPKVTNLNLSWNNIDDEAASALGTLTQIQCLNIAHNKFTFKGIKEIVTLNKNLNTFDVSYNDMTAAQARELLNLPKLSVKLSIDNLPQTALSSQSASFWDSVSSGNFHKLTPTDQEALKHISENTSLIHANLTQPVLELEKITTSVATKTL